jgi:hypothetical protein
MLPEKSLEISRQLCSVALVKQQVAKHLTPKVTRILLHKYKKHGHRTAYNNL